MLKAEASATDINSSETKMTLKKKICAAHRQGKKDTLAAKSHPPPSSLGRLMPPPAVHQSALILMGRFLVSCLDHFGTDKNPLKKCYTSSKCIMRLHGHYLNGRSDVLQLAETQTVGGV